MKKLIVCLGNPGTEYEGTRHNLGFMVADILSNKFKRSRSCPLIFAIKERNPSNAEKDGFFVIKPTTYMNRSGVAVQCILSSLKAEINNLLIVCDDFNLPLGKIRLRESGSSGGHNGLQSIIESLGVEDFNRLRMGTGGSDIEDKTAFVLEKFNGRELKIVKEMIMDVQNVINFYLENGIEASMNRFN